MTYTNEQLGRQAFQIQLQSFRLDRRLRRQSINLTCLELGLRTEAEVEAARLDPTPVG